MRKLLGYARIFYNWQIQKNTILDYVPEDISIELTNTCNFKCSFCPQSDPSHFDRVARSSLSPEQVDTLLSKLRKGGVKTNVIHWTLDGEPFINQSIDEICAVAIRNGFYKFIFSTNGYFCTPERVLKLPKNHPDVSYTFWVDYCADSELFERHRGTPNSWERVRTNILKILEHPQLQHININLTDISSFKISDPNVLSQNLVALKQLFPESDRFNVTSRIFHNATGFVPGILERKKDKNTKYNLCPYPWTSFVIASNGEPKVFVARAFTSHTAMMFPSLATTSSSPPRMVQLRAMIVKPCDTYQSAARCSAHRARARRIVARSRSDSADRLTEVLPRSRL